LECTFRRTAKGDDPKSHAFLYVYEIPVDPSKVLHSINFPQNRAIRVAAVTADHRPTYQTPPPIR
jgi:hypothetical protein